MKKKEEWKHLSPEDRIRAAKIKHHYGLSWKAFETMFNEQGGRCAICATIINKTGIRGQWNTAAVDHCHKTKKIRGLLCNHCNLAIGYLKDSPEIAEAALIYLKSC